MVLLATCVAVLVASAIFYLLRIYSKFSSHGVKQLTPVPFVGNIWKVLTKKMHYVEIMEKIYNSFPDDRFVGHFEFLVPILQIQDLDLIKKITVKDFDYFTDHRMILADNIEPIFTRNLFSLRGRDWKDMRPTLSPAFTSSKIRLMVPFMTEIGEQMISSLNKKIVASERDWIDIDTKDLLTRYANDVIASCAFGLNIDSHSTEDNEFFKMGKIATNFDGMQMIKLICFNAIPAIMKVREKDVEDWKHWKIKTYLILLHLMLIPNIFPWYPFCQMLKVSLCPDATRNFYRNLVISTMHEREMKNIKRNDMIHLLMEAKKGQLIYEEKSNKDTDVGFATVEESEVGRKHIKREVLRLWPPILMTDRVCVKDYNLGRPHEDAPHDYIIHKGDIVNIPIWVIHRSPKYFPNPLKFDPERFSNENKHNIKPFTYMPFGVGPRNCIASRFALCEVKVMLYLLLLHMEVKPAERTRIPVVLSKKSADSFNLRMDGGHWLRFKKRN